jgi:tetrahydromethanopterin S-methyltransferase subunit E
MRHLIQFWYLNSPAWVWHAFLTTYYTLDGHLAVADTARNLGKPLFQDYTYQGRIIGVLLRLVRIAGGILLYALVGLVYALGFLVWLFFPLICLASIFGAFLASSGSSTPSV